MLAVEEVQHMPEAHPEQVDLVVEVLHLALLVLQIEAVVVAALLKEQEVQVALVSSFLNTLKQKIIQFIPLPHQVI